MLKFPVSQHPFWGKGKKALRKGDMNVIQITISYLYYQLNFLTTSRTAWSALCGALCEQPMHSNPAHHTSLLLRNGQSICSSFYISDTYHYHLPLAFFFSRSLLAFISWISLGDSAASPSGAQQLYSILLSMGTAETGSITHTQMVDQGVSILCQERERGLQTWNGHIFCVYVQISWQSHHQMVLQLMSPVISRFRKNSLFM